MKTPIAEHPALYFLSLLAVLVLAACSPDQPSQSEDATFDLDLNAVLGGNNTDSFLRADSPRTFSFPADHGMHPGFRNEWWYLTGNLETETGRQFGYQATFFNTSFNGDSLNSQNIIEGWQSPRIWMAHMALTDVDGNEHMALERFSRENPGLAGAQLNPFKVWLENWSLSSKANGFPWLLAIEDNAFALSLSLTPLKAPVLQGDNGLSQKSPEAGNASYYYSLTRIDSEGEIVLNGESYAVTGLSWLDREWSTSALAENQSGWDWFSLQFDDGQELMYYQLRDNAGLAHPSSDGNWTDANAMQTRINSEDILLVENKHWLSPTGISYTTEWAMQYEDQQWLIRTLVEDQFMNLSVPYWEGTVEILSADNGDHLGRGYLEMVRN
jgi:predicted secreted hydrolase